jgi:DNA-binding GntR family transcriptional regulator
MAAEERPKRRRTLCDLAYRRLRDLLIAGQLAPGDRLSVREIASQLGISPMPVREAVNRFVADDALEVKPQSAVFVPLMTRERFVELRAMRIALEGMATAEAARRASPSELEAIRVAHAHLSQLVASPRPDPAAVVRGNQELHFAIYSAAHMPSLSKVIERFWLQVGPVLNFDLRTTPERLRRLAAHDHHANLVAALLHRDSPAARRALVKDIQSAADYILSLNVLPPSL